MDFTYYPTNVIYNTHSPNQNKCINPEAKSIANTINDGVDFNRFKVSFINRFQVPPNFIGTISDRLKNFPQPPVFSANQRRNQHPIPTRNSQVQHVRAPPIPEGPPINISAQEVESLLKARFNCTHAKDFLKFARSAGNRINVGFRATKKADTIQWLQNNWSQINQVLDDLEV
ncbi:hypothetical protein TVAG_031750 [Trichomonas vaginalis G3]|uniref:Uncharacterized protein n=1 Tax=Trichomonas vaginalis (strain ATCC PRA-98 / G3) TaxID=412133 RepID=A2EUH4_TRIV3|nr:hypothetical protein TVAGG3_0363480 [Trichomonas vaginalis G3]EAY03676.1 hypothetical protein TVAG_031750 [Trichomonas vaginalis G3]KAI5532106.1 hypothetical protein TVAGG3_0363480 [Trichomonas vaginalis G3]|eukprot:XP_001315899.1 hypothetical protein [Trichomonas vaginalis G3]